MAELFTDNAITELASDLSAAATVINVAVGAGALFSAPTVGNFQMITISDDTNTERMTLIGRTADALVVTRNATAYSFLTGAQVIAAVGSDSMELLQAGIVAAAASVSAKLTVDNTGNANGTNALTIQSGRSNVANVASGDQSLSIGYDSKSSFPNGIAIGTLSKSLNYSAIAIGTQSDSQSISGISVGVFSQCVGESGIAIGESAVCEGHSSSAMGLESSCLGFESTAIGYKSRCNIPRARSFSGLSVLHLDSGVVGSNEVTQFNVCEENIIFSNDVDLTAIAGAVLFDVRSDCRFYPTEVGVIIAASSGVTVNPSVSFGFTGNTDSVIASIAVTKISQFQRTQFLTLLNNDGQIQLNASVTSVATATTLVGRFYVKGFYVQAS